MELGNGVFGPRGHRCSAITTLFAGVVGGEGSSIRALSLAFLEGTDNTNPFTRFCSKILVDGVSGVWRPVSSASSAGWRRGEGIDTTEG
jgi:hypothetical protein